MDIEEKEAFRNDFEQKAADHLGLDSYKLEEANDLLRKVHKKSSGAFMIFWYVASPLLILYLIITAAMGNMNAMKLILSLLFIIIPPIVGIAKHNSRERRFYKKLLPELLADAFRDCNPEPMKAPPKNFFESVPLDRYSTTCITVNPESDFGKAKAYLYLKRDHQSGDENEGSYYTLEQGLVINVYPREGSLPCKIFINNEQGMNYEKIEKIIMLNPLIRILGAFAKSGIQQIKLESPKFESEFSVRSDDQLFVRKLLTPVKMEDFIRFKGSHGKFNYYYNKDKLILHFPEFRIIHPDGFRGSGYPEKLSAADLLHCRRALESIIKDLPLIWE